MKVRLFPGGPEFPAEFLDAVQKGEVVFFCGAGLSVGTGLPLFPGLVRELDGILNPDPDDRFAEGRTDYDRMLSELEDRFVPGRMRKHARAILSKPPQDPKGILSEAVLENHRNILNLAATPGGGVRLVTTNFDDRFALANGGEIRSDDAPKMPVPESPGWSSLVHLHGRICEGGDLSDLVLTAADFGRAYLSEGWARRFVVRLMRRWLVAFVGYGLDDPPMRYLMDAAYDPRGNPDGFHPQAFALDGCKTGEKDERRLEWESKRVIPILYDDADDYAALRPILRELARLKDEPNCRAEKAIQGTDGNPDDEGGDNGRRVVWALNNPVTAQTFAERKFFPDTADGEKFVRWLDAFKKAGLFQADNAAPIDALPPVANHLAFWAARHAHQPALLWWLASSDGTPHPRFIWRLLHFINGAGGIKPQEMPDRLVEMWNLHLQERLALPFCGLLLDESLSTRTKSELAESNWEQLLLAALRPRPRVIPDASFRPSEEWEQFKVEVDIDCEMDRADNDAYSAREYAKKPEFVMAHAEALVAHMEDAASLMTRCGIDTRRLRCFRPEEDDDYGDGAPAHWLFLTLLVRNAVLGMIKGKEVARLKNLVPRWMGSEHLLMRRLALFTVTETAKLPKRTRLPVDWGAKTITARPDILWTLESGRESCRFLRKAGAGITPSLLAKLERVIREGPSRSNAPEEDVAQVMRWEVPKFLAKLELSGTRLSPESARMLADARAAEPEIEFENLMEYHKSKIVGFSMRGIGPVAEPDAPKWADMTADECANHIRTAERLNLAPFVKDHLDKAVEAFEILAEREFWNRAKWSLFLNGFERNQDIPGDFAVRLIRLLGAMPEGLAHDLARDCARLLEVIPRTLPFTEMEKAWRRAWEFDLDPSPTISGNHHISQLDIAINHAHGRLAEIPLVRFGQQEERDKLSGVLAEILASEKPSHKHGQILIGSRLSLLFHDCPEWTRRRLLPFFAPKHPMAFGMWEAFLYHPTVSVELLAALKPGLTRFLKRVDDFHERADNLVGIFVIGCLSHPKIITQDEKRRMVAGMSSQGIQHLCRHMERKIWDGDGAALAKTWRESVFPFLREVWPEKRPTAGEASDISRALASVVILTGDAFPEAFQWAEDFLSPIVGHGHPRHPVTSFLYGHQKQAKNIPAQFPRACLLFLDRIVPDEGFYHRDKLRAVLDKIKAANPDPPNLDLEKHPAYIRLWEIASGG